MIVFCPNCGTSLTRFPNNQPVADFYCTKCFEEYELKSKKDNMSKKLMTVHILQCFRDSEPLIIPIYSFCLMTNPQSR